VAAENAVAIAAPVGWDWGKCPDSEVRIILAATTTFANFGIEGHLQTIDLVWLWFRSPHDELAATAMRTSEPPHEPFINTANCATICPEPRLMAQQRSSKVAGIQAWPRGRTL
jgi:hypothetical protein